MVMSRAKRGESPALFYAGGDYQSEPLDASIVPARERLTVTNSYSLGLMLDSYVYIRYN